MLLFLTELPQNQYVPGIIQKLVNMKLLRNVTLFNPSAEVAEDVLYQSKGDWVTRVLIKIGAILQRLLRRMKVLETK
jgi:hypothetical protein